MKPLPPQHAPGEGAGQFPTHVAGPCPRGPLKAVPSPSALAILPVTASQTERLKFNYTELWVPRVLS